MIKWPKTALEWVHLFWMIATGAVVLILLSMFMQIVWMGSDLKQWDVLAFSGSVIGGVITWVGVRVTIKHSEEIVNRDRKEKAQEAAAKKIRILDKIETQLLEIEWKLELWISHIVKLKSDDEFINKLDISAMNEIQNIITQIVDQSVNVDAEVYKSLVKLERLTKEKRREEEIYILNIHLKMKVDVYAVFHPLQRKIQSSLADILERRSFYLDILFPDKPFSFID